MLGVLATVLNVVLSTILITGIGGGPQLGVRGAALATCIAPLISVIIAFFLLLRGKTIILFPKRLNLIPDVTVMRAVARIGLPTGVQGVLLNIGGVILLAYIGGLEEGAAAQAAFAICYAQLFSVVAWPSRGLRNAAATLIGQNIGAGKTRRGRTAVHVAAGLGALWAVGMGATLYLLFPRALLGLFDATEEPVFGFGVILLRYLALAGVFLAAGLAYTGGLNGAGDTRTPMYIAFFTQIVLLLALCHVASTTGNLTAHAIWMFVFICHAARFVLTYAVFLRGRWTRIKVEFEET
jgi:Na+-driven multidrug efflux pump